MHAEGALFLVGAVVLATVSGQVFLPQFIQPPPAQQALTYNQPLVAAPSQNYAHRDVLINSQAESQLPDHLLNPFYKNPRVAQALAKESWFGPGEMLVNDRETQKIPRTNIFSMLKNAGLARRRTSPGPSSIGRSIRTMTPPSAEGLPRSIVRQGGAYVL